MILDLTHTISPEMPVYPGTPNPRLFPAARLDQHGYRETQISMVSHTGTHMDAPRHILREGSSLDQLPPSQFCGRAAIVDVSKLGEGAVITAEFLKAQNGELLNADFVLLYTGWEKKWCTPSFLEERYPVLDEEAARYLVSCGLKGVGVDCISVDPIDTETYPVHHVLLGGGLVIVENLCLKKVVGRQDVMFFALPLKYAGADGAPVRAIAEFRDFSEKEMTEA